MRGSRIGIVVALAGCLGQLGIVDHQVVAAAGTETWLEALNEYRSESDLVPVVDEPSWSAGIIDHLTYLANTPPDLRTDPYASVHEENPASAYSTPEGVLAGHSANLGMADTPSEAIDRWMTSPFHALGLLRPGLRRSAFGQLGKAVGLDVLRGIEAAPSQQVLFPGDGSVVDVDSYAGHESPSPLESCVDQSFEGLPIVAMLTSAPSEQLTATLTMPDGRVLRGANELCVVTASTYRSTDAVYGSLGLELLRGSNAVVVLPREPLARGAYTVELTQPLRSAITWTFGVGSFGTHAAFVGPDAPLRVRAGSPGSTVIGTLTVDGPVGAGFLTMYPCADGRPEASSLNYAAGQTIANTFVSAVDADGFVCVFAMSPTNVIVDVVGETTVLDGVHSPERVVDTRSGLTSS